MKSADQVLIDAAEILSEKGWCQGKLVDGEEHVCAMGAIQIALGWEIIDSLTPSFAIDPFDYGFGMTGFPQTTFTQTKVKALRPGPTLDPASYNTFSHGGETFGSYDNAHLAGVISECQDRIIRTVREGRPFEAVASVPEWNDRPDTSAEDVILTLKRAAHLD